MNKEYILNLKPGLELNRLVWRMIFGKTMSMTIDSYHIPNFSENIEEAWKVVDEMRKRSGCIGCKACIEIHGTDELDKPYLAFIHGQEADGETASEAICKAALLSVYGEDNE